MLKSVNRSFPDYHYEPYLSYINSILDMKNSLYYFNHFFRILRSAGKQIPLIHKENIINKLPNLLNEKSHYFLIYC